MGHSHRYQSYDVMKGRDNGEVRNTAANSRSYVTSKLERIKCNLRMQEPTEM